MGSPKYLLREALKGILPEDIRTRRDKAEFSEVLRDQINAIDLDTFWKKKYIVDLKIVQENEIDKIINEFKKMDSTVSPYIVGKLWRLINLEQWYRVNFIH